MLPRIIALQGVNNCGKTTTIRMAFDEFLGRPTTTVLANPPRLKEVRGAVTEIDGVMVGWVTLGDLDWILKDQINKLKRKCQVIGCACRSYGATVYYLRGLEGEGFEVTWIDKPRVEEAKFIQANRRKAAELVGAIEAAVEEVKAELMASA